MLITVQQNPGWQLSLAQLSPSLLGFFLNFYHKFFSLVTYHVSFQSVLTINLKTVWNTGFVDTDDTEISNKNLRYASYRSLFYWLR